MERFAEQVIPLVAEAGGRTPVLVPPEAAETLDTRTPFGPKGQRARAQGRQLGHRNTCFGRSGFCSNRRVAG